MGQILIEVLGTLTLQRTTREDCRCTRIPGLCTRVHLLSRMDLPALCPVPLTVLATLRTAINRASTDLALHSNRLCGCMHYSYFCGNREGMREGCVTVSQLTWVNKIEDCFRSRALIHSHSDRDKTVHLDARRPLASSSPFPKYCQSRNCAARPYA